MKLRFFVLVYFSLLVSTRSLESTGEEKLDKAEEPSIELDSTTTLAPQTNTDGKTENESSETINESEAAEKIDPVTSAPKIEEQATIMTEKSETDVNPGQQTTSVPVTEPIDTFPDTTKVTEKSETGPVIESTDEPITVVTKKTETNENVPVETTLTPDIAIKPTDATNSKTTTGKIESETITIISDSTVELTTTVTEESKTDEYQPTTLASIPTTKPSTDNTITPGLEPTTDGTPKSEIDSTEEPIRPKLTFWQKLKYLLSPRKPYIFIIVGCIGFVLVSFLIFGFSRLLVYPEQSHEYNVAAHIERGRDNSRIQQFQLDFYKKSTDVVIVN